MRMKLFQSVAVLSAALLISTADASISLSKAKKADQPHIMTIKMEPRQVKNEGGWVGTMRDLDRVDKMLKGEPIHPKLESSPL